jgi:hypothetical protein
MPSNADSSGAVMALRCSQCGSDHVIPSGRLTVFNAGVAALVLADGTTAGVNVWICGNCGHVGLRAEHPGTLFEAYARSMPRA